LQNGVLSARKCMEAYLFSPSQLISNISKMASLSLFGSFLLVLTYLVRSSSTEKKVNREMQKIVKKLDNPDEIISNFPEKQIFRNEGSLRKLFEDLNVPIKKLIINDSCFVIEI
jgi:hypothetical protein